MGARRSVAKIEIFISQVDRYGLHAPVAGLVVSYFRPQSLKFEAHLLTVSSHDNIVVYHKIIAMSSLVTEVLLQAGKLDKEDLHTKVSKLTTQSSEIKSKIFNYVESKYGDQNPMFSSLPVMLRDIQDQQTEAEDIQRSISGAVKTQLRDSTGEFERLTKELSETNELLYAIEKICCLCDLYDSQFSQKKNGNWKESTSSLLDIEECLNEIKKSSLVDLQIFKFLNNEYIVVLDDFVYLLEEKWMGQVSWTMPDKKDGVENLVLKMPDLKIDDNADTLQFRDLVIAMSKLKRLRPKIERLAKIVLQHILVPLIKDETLAPKLDDDNSTIRNAITLTLKKSSTSKNVRTPSLLFKQVFNILEYLNQNLLHLPLSDDDDDDHNATVMSIFSKYIRDDLLQCLIDNCLFATIPQNKDELRQYKDVEDTVRKFETALVAIGFLESTTDEDTNNGPGLVTYAMNVSVHFASRRCTDILQQARNLMKKGIHNTRIVKHKDISQFQSVFSTHDNSLVIRNMPLGTDFDSQKPSTLLRDETMLFPTCQVSECAIDIKDLAFKTMQEACQSAPDCAVRLVATAQNIFELYQTVFPIFHKDTLENIPQQSAVFHNDCMYLAHHLLTLGHQFSKMSEYAKKTMHGMTFVDKVPYLRRLGAEVFLQQLKSQKQMMVQCLEPLHSFATMRSHDKFSVVEKSLKQVLYQLNHLKKVWLEVLPTHTLLRALGNLVNYCITEVVSTVCAIEDISSDDSVSLRLACELLLLQVPSVFQDSSKNPDLSWRQHVAKWSRLEELVFLLSSSLREIVDRWADGKGPLANAFSIVEVKRFIRALFQNTEHRAQAISKIRF